MMGLVFGTAGLYKQMVFLLSSAAGPNITTLNVMREGPAHGKECVSLQSESMFTHEVDYILIDINLFHFFDKRGWPVVMNQWMCIRILPERPFKGFENQGDVILPS